MDGQGTLGCTPNYLMVLFILLSWIIGAYNPSSITLIIIKGISHHSVLVVVHPPLPWDGDSCHYFQFPAFRKSKVLKKHVDVWNSTR